MTDTRYTPELAAAICKRVSEGEPLRQVCRDQGMPPESSVRQWSRDDRNGFAAQYQAARMMQVESWADEIIMTGNRDDLEPHDKRVRCDNLKWLLSKLAPKKFGERLLLAGDAESPIQHLHAQVSLRNLTDDQINALDRFTQSLIDPKQS